MRRQYFHRRAGTASRLAFRRCYGPACQTYVVAERSRKRSVRFVSAHAMTVQAGRPELGRIEQEKAL